VRVSSGTALLPKSGNAGALHQHFHVIDRQSPLDASGLLLVFRLLAGDAAATKEPRAESGKPATLGATLGGARANALPPANSVDDIGRAP
jgi:hypothetical protein